MGSAIAGISVVGSEDLGVRALSPSRATAHGPRRARERRCLTDPPRPLVEQIKKHDNNLAKQLVDAANSTVQNLAEGARHRGGNKRARFDIAHGEANEMKGSLDVALAWGYIKDDSAARVKLRRLLALCWA